MAKVRVSRVVIEVPEGLDCLPTSLKKGWG